jgi:hypothetical protein
LVFAALGHRQRRRLLFSLALNGPRAGVHLKMAAHRLLDATLKQLAVMRRAGLVVMEPDPTDGRRFRYALSPNVPLQDTPEGKVMDFGFCLVRLAEAQE